MMMMMRGVRRGEGKAGRTWGEGDGAASGPVGCVCGKGEWEGRVRLCVSVCLCGARKAKRRREFFIMVVMGARRGRRGGAAGHRRALHHALLRQVLLFAAS